jgi:thiol:disulfide interchange protein DsbD
MSGRRSVGIALALACAIGLARAQEVPVATSLVKAAAAPVSVRAGASANVTVRVTIAAGWHVYSNPPSLDYNIPTQVSLDAAPGLEPGKSVYPPGRTVKLASDEAAMSVYDGAIEVTIPLAAATTAANGAHAMRGTVRYQACNNQMCLAPVSVPFTVKVTVSGGGAGATAAPAETAAVAAGASPTPGAGFMTAPPAEGADTGSASQRRLLAALEKGWLWWLLALFAGGLALNLTPCVFPMLGITVSIFGARRAEATPRVVANAAAYVLGIVAMYTALGVVAALTGGLFGAALQNPLVNVGLGLLLVALSLSMFGLYELQAPTWLLDRAGGANTGSLAGLFVSGLAVGVIAAPCVGPFVLGVLALIAQRGSVAFGVQTMATLSFGLGFPYLLLATFSNLLGGLPRAGEWMDWVKKFFGVLLASIGLSYALLGMLPAVATWLAPAALLLGGLYLGFMEKSGNARAGFRAFKRVVGVAGVLAGVALALQITTARARAIPFRPYDEAAVQASLAAGRGVMVDFSADWCVPCHELELQVFPNRDVVAAARAFDAYKADLTHGDTPASKRWHVGGVPTVVFLGAGGVEVRAARVEGVVGAAEFARRVRLAGQGLASR